MSLMTRTWTIDDAAASGHPAVLTTDSAPRLVYGTRGGDVVAIDGAGNEVWRTPTGCSIATWPSIGELSGLGTCVLAGTLAGDVICLSPDGAIHWRTRVDGEMCGFNSVSVVRGGDAAVVATTRHSVVAGLSTGGNPVWEFHTHPAPMWRERGVGSVTVGDIDSDGRDEIAFCAADGRLYCIDADGAYRWDAYIGMNSHWSAPVFADLGSGPCVLAGGTANHLHCFDPNGTLLWKQRGAGAGNIEIGISLADIDGDGADEAVFVFQQRAIHAVDGDGSLMWCSHGYFGGDQPCGPSIADLNGDGRPEMLLGRRNGGIHHLITADGELIEEFEIPGGVFGAPIIADIDGDGLLEVVASAMRDGAIICYGTEAPAKDAVMWPSTRGDFDGRANRLAPVDTLLVRAERPVGSAPVKRISTDALRLGTNHLAYETGADNRVVEVIATGPDGIPKRAVLGGVQRCCMDLEVLDPGAYSIAATLIDTESYDRLGTLTEEMSVSLFDKECDEADRLLGDLDEIAKSAGSARPELDRIRRMLRLRWRDIEDRIQLYRSLSVSGRRRFVEEVQTLLAALKREGACQRMRCAEGERLGAPTAYLPSQLEHPWMQFDPDADIPGSPLGELTIRTDGGGHDALAIQVANCTGGPLDVRVWLDQIIDADGNTHNAADHLELRQVTWVPTTRCGDMRSEEPGRMAPDALPDLGDGGILRIAPSSSSRLWIDVLTKDLAPGTYTTTLRMRALTEAVDVREIPVHWTVDAISLPEAMPLHFCNWSHGYAKHFGHAEDAAFADMQNHYTSVFLGRTNEPIQYDADGNLLDEPDWTPQDELLDRMRPQNVVLYSGLPLRPVEGVPGEYSDAWKKAFAAFLPVWTQHLAEKGFGYERWAFYPVDEPGLDSGMLIGRLERFARFVKSLDPKVRMYTDPYRGMTVDDYKRLTGMLDIVQPVQYYVVLAEDRDRIDYLRTTDQTHWIFEAMWGVKDHTTPWYYWEQIWTAWEIGFTGIGYWTYCTTGFDLWEGAADFVLVYQGARGPVSSRRWQAIRIGIEDYARMARLRDAAESARNAGRAEEADRALRRLDEMTGEAKAVRWEPGLVARIRREIVDLTLDLTS